MLLSRAAYRCENRPHSSNCTACSEHLQASRVRFIQILKFNLVMTVYGMFMPLYRGYPSKSLKPPFLALICVSGNLAALSVLYHGFEATKTASGIGLHHQTLPTSLVSLKL
jgi:hypothetical protein